jgi:hypothetical protein
MKDIKHYKNYLDVLYYKICKDKNINNKYKNEIDEYKNNIYPYINYLFIDIKLNRDNKIKNTKIIKDIYYKYKIENNN